MTAERNGERAPKTPPPGPEDTRRAELAEDVRRLNRWSSGGGGRR
ncbi:hypothetical protein [Streptomyces sp. NPDC002067]